MDYIFSSSSFIYFVIFLRCRTSLLNNELEFLITRAAGHAVATAHMADHSMGPVYYGLKAIKIIGGSSDSELKWQIEQIPEEIKELVINGLKNKGIIK